MKLIIKKQLNKRLIKLYTLVIFLCLPAFVNAQAAYKGGNSDGYAETENSKVYLSSKNNSNFNLITLFPNPQIKGKTVFLNWQNVEEIYFSITDINGVILYISTKYIGNSLKLPTENLPEGIYFITIRQNNYQQKLKLVIL